MKLLLVGNYFINLTSEKVILESWSSESTIPYRLFKISRTGIVKVHFSGSSSHLEQSGIVFHYLYKKCLK
uniref:Uncharacterized protein n=1 Tax=Strongyloides venezuelensis TaxID=75913 RepID=A0A0K0G2B3_STRVS